MESRTLLSVFTLLVLLCLLNHGEALKCHQCTSYDTSKCADPFVTEEGKLLTEEFLMECPADGKNYTICRKIFQNVRGDERVIRTCGYEKYKNDCYKTVMEEYNTYVCQCEGDGCNPAGYIRISSFAVVFSVLLSFLFR